MKDKQTKKKKYANIRHESDHDIKVALFPKGKIRHLFYSKKDAQKKLNEFRDKYIVSRVEEEDEPSPNELKIWIRGYFINNESERRKKLYGDFVIFKIVRFTKIKNFKYTFSYQKLDIEAKYHPQRKNNTKGQRHPNWGVPSLRDIKKGRQFDSFEEAHLEFEKLMLNFPEVYRKHGREVLRIMIFDKGGHDEITAESLEKARIEKAQREKARKLENEQRKLNEQNPELAKRDVNNSAVDATPLANLNGSDTLEKINKKMEETSPNPEESLPKIEEIEKNSSSEIKQLKEEPGVPSNEHNNNAAPKKEYTSPIKKWVLKIIELPNNKFMIEARLNKHQVGYIKKHKYNFYHLDFINRPYSQIKIQQVESINQTDVTETDVTETDVTETDVTETGLEN